MPHLPPPGYERRQAQGFLPPYNNAIAPQHQPNHRHNALTPSESLWNAQEPTANQQYEDPYTMPLPRSRLPSNSNLAEAQWTSPQRLLPETSAHSTYYETQANSYLVTPWSTTSPTPNQSLYNKNRQSDYPTRDNYASSVSSPIGTRRSSSPFDASAWNAINGSSSSSSRHSFSHNLQEAISPPSRRGLDWGLWSPSYSSSEELPAFDDYIDDSLSTSVTSLTFDSPDIILQRERRTSAELYERSAERRGCKVPDLTLSPQSQPSPLLRGGPSPRLSGVGAAAMFASVNSKIPYNSDITPPPGLLHTHNGQAGALSSSASSTASSIASASTAKPISWAAIAKTPAKPPTIPNNNSHYIPPISPVHERQQRAPYTSPPATSDHHHNHHGGMATSSNHYSGQQRGNNNSNNYTPSLHHASSYERYSNDRASPDVSESPSRMRNPGSSVGNGHGNIRESSSRMRNPGSSVGNGHGVAKGLVGAPSSSISRYSLALDGPAKQRVQELIAARGLNLTHKTFNCKTPNARYFVIKSYTEEDVHRSIKYSIWSSTEIGNRRLSQAWQESSHLGPIYLFFSVNASGHFCGVAEMASGIDWNRSSDVWLQGSKYKGTFAVRFIFVKDVPNSLLKHLRVRNNENKPVTNSRDTQEVDKEVGQPMLNIFVEHKARTTLLDDFSWYDGREEDRRSSNISDADSDTSSSRPHQATNGNGRGNSGVVVARHQTNGNGSTIWDNLSTGTA
ncbi:hypothetical protein SmJEL517_g06116 [Synchytrium microbalum]|uniref:YTH domain-containing protein n=1 Tax=Synchytrium microbalum TaxID=1806994 RepID=A0A507BKA5_9FUNG|nr:uncharacterized protein SmJEL517_g06116 [Synchytrium microbalum]TPX30297.1 hypothetical protein SmJEL517_g06116 [Synchytrium microbalum]